MRDLAAQQRYAHALRSTQADLSSLLGYGVGADQAISREGVCAAIRAITQQSRAHQSWHRVWGVRLRDEMLDLIDRLAEALIDERAVLLWQSSVPVGFELPVPVALRLADQVGVDGPGQDLVLVGDAGDSGLVLAYERLPDAEQFELASWGRFAMPITSPDR